MLSHQALHVGRLAQAQQLGLVACKRPYARAKMLQKRGLTEERAWRSATNERGA